MTTQAKPDSVATIPAQHQHLSGSTLVSRNGQAAADHLPDISPLGLSLNVPHCHDGDYLDWLLKELDLYTSAAGNHHKMQQIWFQGDGLIKLSPAELTQLAYRVGSQFKLADGDNCEYGIEICHTQITPDYLALLRGLRFKQLRIHFGACQCLSHGDWISEVAENIELLGNYDFEEIYCRVHLGDIPNHGDIKKLLLSLHLYQPQQIELTGISGTSAPSYDNCTFYIGLMEFLTQRGYHVLGNHLFVSESSRLNQLRQQHNLAFTPLGFCSRQVTGWIGAGLGAAGYLNDCHYQNSNNLDEYKQNLQANALPRNQTGVLPEQHLGIQEIVQSLFCHGELNGRTVEQLPIDKRFAVESVVVDASEKLWIEPAGYLWRLTPGGQIHLRQLFSCLMKALETPLTAITTQKMSI